MYMSIAVKAARCYYYRQPFLRLLFVDCDALLRPKLGEFTSLQTRDLQVPRFSSLPIRQFVVQLSELS